MRTKTRGVKASRSKIPLKSPSSITNNNINDKPGSPNGDEYDSIGNSDTDYSRLPLNSASRSTVAKKHHESSTLNSAPSSTFAKKRHESGSLGCMEMETEWTEKPTCLKCNRGGLLLVCSSRDCPVAFHEQCLSGLASSDDLSFSGNFYCPYCFYKRALAETAQLKKNAMLAKEALTSFIDTKRPDGNRQKRKAERAKVDEPSSSKIRMDKNQTDNENRRTSDPDHQFVQEEEHASAADCIRSSLPDNVLETLSIMEKKNDVLMSRGVDTATLTDYGQHTNVVENEMNPKTSVADCNENHAGKETTPSKELSEPLIFVGKTNEVKNTERHQVTVAVVGEGSKEEHSEQADADDHRHEEVLEDEQQAEPLKGVCSEEEMSRTLNFSTKRKRDNEDIFKEVEDRTGKAGLMQTQAQETTVSSTGADPTLEVLEQAADPIQEIETLAADQRHAEENVQDRNEKVTIAQLHNPLKQGSETTDSLHEDTRTLAKEQRPVSRRTQNKRLPQDVSPSKSSSGLLNTTVEDNAGDRNEQDTTSSKTRQLQSPSKKFGIPILPNARRKKLMWTVAEEEILKEGLQKLSSKNKNKNISWRKILEFGRDVFDQSRTPEDLRDKWRNNLAKQCSSQ